MDPRFAPAWIAFGHTFALEGEHDHAVTAYSTCARMFTGYDPPLDSRFFYPHHCVQFTSPADVCRYGAYHVIKPSPSGRSLKCGKYHVRWRPAASQWTWSNDLQPWRVSNHPTTIQVFIYSCSYGGAAALFQEALDLAQVTQTSRKSWSMTYINLGTCYRKLRWVEVINRTLLFWLAIYRRLEDAKATYQKVLELDPYHPVALGFLGMVFHLLGDLDKAILKYHEVRPIFVKP